MSLAGIYSPPNCVRSNPPIAVEAVLGVMMNKRLYLGQRIAISSAVGALLLLIEQAGP
jgi:hypothetical protein